MRRLLLFVLLLFAGPAMAAPIDDARARHQAAVRQQATVSAERAHLASAQERLARQIEALKSTDRPLLPGVRDGRLDELLKTSNAQADRLSQLDRRLGAARAEVEAATEALGATLTQALAQTQQALASAAVADRAALFARLRDLADEQARLASARPTGSTEAVALPAAQGDDPDELRELADEAGDHAEQMRAQLLLVEQRLGELRTRRRLLRAEVAFRRDELLFAESERNRVVVQTQVTPGRAVVETPPSQRPVVDSSDSDTNQPPPTEGNPGSPEDIPTPGDPEASGGGEDGREQEFDNGAEPDDTPSVGLQPEPEPTPVAQLPTTDEVAPAAADGALVVGDVLDPSLLTDAVDALSPQDLSQRIRAIEAQRKALESSVDQLDARRKALHDRAEALENE